MKLIRPGLAAAGLLVFACGATDDQASDDQATPPAPSNEPPPAPTGEAPIDEPDSGAEDPGERDDDQVDVTKDTVNGFPGRYASPTIVRDGATYHVYFAAQRFNGTSYHVPHATFDDKGDFKVVGDALPKLGKNAVNPVWAPAAAQVGANQWVLYYTAKLDGTTSKKCIWRAHSKTADGPFVDDYDGPLYCAPATLWVIDPYLSKDEKGQWWLSARVDEPGGINTIQIRPLGPNALGFAAGSSWKALTRNAPTSWEQPVLENAAVVRLEPKTGAAHWFVYYSARAYTDNRYAIGIADCGTTISGPAGKDCQKKTPNGPAFGTDAAAGVFGPGTPTFYENAAGDTLMSIQAWQYSGGQNNPKNHGQIMRTYKVTIDDKYDPTFSLVRVDL